jgi:hypothetical protein
VLQESISCVALGLTAGRGANYNASFYRRSSSVFTC